MRFTRRQQSLLITRQSCVIVRNDVKMKFEHILNELANQEIHYFYLHELEIKLNLVYFVFLVRTLNFDSSTILVKARA